MVAAAPPLADQVEPQKVQLECDPDSEGSTIEKRASTIRTLPVQMGICLFWGEVKCLSGWFGALIWGVTFHKPQNCTLDAYPHCYADLMLPFLEAKDSSKLQKLVLI